MVNLILNVLVASVIAVGFVDLVKNFFPKASTAGKTVIGIVFEVLVGIGVSFVSSLFDNTSVLTGVLRAIVTAVGTVGASQFCYTYIASLISAIKNKLSNKE
ncbi:MAG: hypothetical protein HUJ68_11875 [Clostridia bacterium]|nr:hypothetical protein [Clostridia bacterium]